MLCLAKRDLSLASLASADAGSHAGCMATAALIVAIAAALGSVATAVYARVQAKVGQRQLAAAQGQLTAAQQQVELSKTDLAYRIDQSEWELTVITSWLMIGGQWAVAVVAKNSRHGTVKIDDWGFVLEPDGLGPHLRMKNFPNLAATSSLDEPLGNGIRTWAITQSDLSTVLSEYGTTIVRGAVYPADQAVCIGNRVDVQSPVKSVADAPPP